MIGPILEHEDLARVTRYTRMADIAACLDRQGVKYFHGRNGLWTTQAALDAALGIAPAAGNDARYKPDEVL